MEAMMQKLLDAMALMEARITNAIEGRSSLSDMEATVDIRGRNFPEDVVADLAADHLFGVELDTDPNTSFSGHGGCLCWGDLPCYDEVEAVAMHELPGDAMAAMGAAADAGGPVRLDSPSPLDPYDDIAGAQDLFSDGASTRAVADVPAVHSALKVFDQMLSPGFDGEPIFDKEPNDSIAKFVDVLCHGNGSVQGPQLERLGLARSAPDLDALAELLGLRALSISNEFSSPVTESITSPRLVELSLANNRFKGPLTEDASAAHDDDLNGVDPSTLQEVLSPGLRYSIAVAISPDAEYGRLVLVMGRGLMGRGFYMDAAGHPFTRTVNSTFTLRFDRRSDSMNITDTVPEKMVQIPGVTRLVQASNMSALEVMHEMRKRGGIVTDKYTYDTLISGWCKISRMENAAKVFYEMLTTRTDDLGIFSNRQADEVRQFTFSEGILVGDKLVDTGMGAGLSLVGPGIGAGTGWVIYGLCAVSGQGNFSIFVWDPGDRAVTLLASGAVPVLQELLVYLVQELKADSPIGDLTSTAVKNGGLYSFDASSVYKYKSTTVDVKLDTESNISTTLTVLDTWPSTKLVTSVKLPDYNSGKVELLQDQEHMQGDIDAEMMHMRGIHSMLHTGGAFWWTKLSSCSYNEGLHSYVEKDGLEDELIVRNALVDMYGKCGCIESAHRLFCLMREKDLHSWTPMISGLSCHGRGEEVVGLFFSNDFKAACSHAGLVDEGIHIFNSMESEYNVPRDIKHYGCMVDFFSRAGLVHRAYEFISMMPFEPNLEILGALLSACSIINELEIGELVLNKIDSVCSYKGGAGVLLSNIYANQNLWHEVDTIRRKEQAKLHVIHGSINGADPMYIQSSRAKASSVLMHLAQVCVRSVLLLVNQGNFSVFLWDPGDHAKNSLGTSCISRGGECQHHTTREGAHAREGAG